MILQYLLDKVQTELDGEAANLIIAARELQEGIDSLPIMNKPSLVERVEKPLGRYVVVGVQPEYQN